MEKKILKRKLNNKMTYVDMLKTYGVKELKAIAKSWSLKGYSKMNKDELVDILFECITTELYTELYQFNYDHYSIIASISEGRNETMNYPVAASQLIEMALLIEGAVDNESQLILPEEVYLIFKEFYDKNKQLIETNTLVKDTLELVVNLYGVVSEEFFFDYLKSYANISFKDEHKAYFLDFSISATRNAVLENGYIHHVLLEEYKKVYDDVSSKDEMAYKVIDDQLFMRFLENGNYFWTEAHDTLNILLCKHLDFSISDVYYFLDEMRIMLSYNHGIADFIQHFTKKFDLDMVIVKELADCVITINNEMPHWELKGNAPMELSQYQKQEPIVKGEKIGRNDPCPCGSGKKYKKCCLKSS